MPTPVKILDKDKLFMKQLFLSSTHQKKALIYEYNYSTVDKKYQPCF